MQGCQRKCKICIPSLNADVQDSARALLNVHELDVLTIVIGARVSMFRMKRSMYAPLRLIDVIKLQIIRFRSIKVTESSE